LAGLPGRLARRRSRFGKSIAVGVA